MSRLPDEQSVLLATGTAIMGVFIGGAAVFFGIRSNPVAVVPVDAAVVEPLAVPSAATGDALVDAISWTSDTVVNLSTPYGLGAGVIVDPSGIILTNAHVVMEVLERPNASRGEAHPVRARFENGREVPATVVVADRSEDLAVLRLAPTNPDETFKAAKLGSSSQLRVGQEVFAVGNPFGLPHSVSRGIVSAIDRTHVLARKALGVIQLDASINLGNSGGPLFNLSGEVVGIVTARQERAQGIAFALPVDHISGFLRALTDPAAQRSGMLGVVLGLDGALPAGVQELGYSSALIIQDVQDAGAAKRAGLQPNDAIVTIRGKRLDGLPHADDALDFARHLQQVVRGMFPGERLALDVVRDGNLHTFEVEIAPATLRDQAAIDAEELLGLRLDPRGDKLEVIDIHPRSSVYGLRGSLQHSTIVRFMGEPVEDLTDLGEKLEELRVLTRRHGSAPTPFVGFKRGNEELDLPVRVL